MCCITNIPSLQKTSSEAQRSSQFLSDLWPGCSWPTSARPEWGLSGLEAPPADLGLACAHWSVHISAIKDKLGHGALFKPLIRGLTSSQAQERPEVVGRGCVATGRGWVPAGPSLPSRHRAQPVLGKQVRACRASPALPSSPHCICAQPRAFQSQAACRRGISGRELFCSHQAQNSSELGHANSTRSQPAAFVSNLLSPGICPFREGQAGVGTLLEGGDWEGCVTAALIPPPVSHVLCSPCPRLTGTLILLPTRPLPYFPRPISPHAQAWRRDSSRHAWHHSAPHR